MAWPNEKCPPVTGPLATEHLTYIQNKANAELAAGSPLLTRIDHAVNACRGNICRPTGNPPTDACTHCERLLWARCLATESAWGQCAEELEHGV